MPLMRQNAPVRRMHQCFFCKKHWTKRHRLAAGPLLRAYSGLSWRASKKPAVANPQTRSMNLLNKIPVARRLASDGATAPSLCQVYARERVQQTAGATFLIQRFFFARKKALVPGLHKAKYPRRIAAMSAPHRRVLPHQRHLPCGV